MKKFILFICVLFALGVLISCATTVSDFNKVTRGMSKIQVYEMLGRPTSQGIDAEGRDYYVYNNVMIDGWSNVYGDFQIIFDSNGLVVQYGQINSYSKQEPSYIVVKSK